MPAKLLHLLDMLDSQSSLFKYGLTAEPCDGQVEQRGQRLQQDVQMQLLEKEDGAFIGSPKRKGSHVIFAPGG